MLEGLLWFDNDPQHSLSDRVRQAAARYKTRVGRQATICYVNIAEFDDSKESISGVTLKPAAHIRPHYIWIGVDDSPIAKVA